MRKFRWGAAAAVAAVAGTAALAAASQVSASPTAGTIKIGISLPLSGDLSQPGGAAKQGYEIWQQFVNAKGGLLGKKVVLDIKDDQSDQNTIVADYNRLITQDKVDLLLGTFSSLLNLPASAVAEKYHMVYVEPAGGSPKMFSRGFHYLFFAQEATAPHQADLFANYLIHLPKSKRPKTAAYVTQTDPFTQPVIDGVRAKLQKAGIKTVLYKTYQLDQTDFDPVASTLQSKNPDVVVQGAVFQDGIGLVRAMQKLNYNPKALFITSAPSEGSQFSKGIGTANTQGIFYAVSWGPGSNTPENHKFVSTYEKKYRQVPPEDAADAFATAQVLEAAVKGVGEINQDKIAAWLHSHSVNTVEGKLRWDKTGAPQSQFLLAQWQNGKSELVLPKSVATSKHIVYPKPNWK